MQYADFMNHPVPAARPSCMLDENHVQLECIAFFVKHGWKLVRREWRVVPYTDEHGVGDLVFKRDRIYAVIECKRRAMPQVFEQARFYAAAWLLQHAVDPKPVVLYGAWCCGSRAILGVLQTRAEAAQVCGRSVCAHLAARRPAQPPSAEELKRRGAEEQLKTPKLVGKARGRAAGVAPAVSTRSPKTANRVEGRKEQSAKPLRAERRDIEKPRRQAKRVEAAKPPKPRRKPGAKRRKTGAGQARRRRVKRGA